MPHLILGEVRYPEANAPPISVRKSAMSIGLLEHAIENYEFAVLTLEKADPLPSIEQVLDVLIARDVIYALLRNKARKLGKNHTTLANLDNRLRKQADSITQVADLAELRASFHPASDAWWWFFKRSSIKYWWDRYDRLWNALALLFLVIALCILIDISNRLLTGEPDTLGAIVVTLQTALTPLIIGGLLTRGGQNILDNLLTRIGIPIHFRQEGSLLLATSFLILLTCFYLAMPWVSNIYNNLGFRAYTDNRLATAQTHYRRAIKFNPDHFQAHYNLGSLFEELNDLDRAREEYLLAAQGGLPEGLNNLGRLYLLEGQYPEAAILLNNALNQISSTNSKNDLKYSVLKNLGWARLEQDRLPDAETSLQEAIELIQKKAAAHCLLAQVLEEQGKPAKSEWEQCLRYANGTDPDEDVWAGIAQQRLSSLNSN
jgi:tetratricopeptide (TPR) repeat protein